MAFSFQPAAQVDLSNIIQYNGPPAVHARPKAPDGNDFEDIDVELERIRNACGMPGPRQYMNSRRVLSKGPPPTTSTEVVIAPIEHAPAQSALPTRSSPEPAIPSKLPQPVVAADQQRHLSEARVTTSRAQSEEHIVSSEQSGQLRHAEAFDQTVPALTVSPRRAESTTALRARSSPTSESDSHAESDQDDEPVLLSRHRRRLVRGDRLGRDTQYALRSSSQPTRPASKLPSRSISEDRARLITPSLSDDPVEQSGTHILKEITLWQGHSTITAGSTLVPRYGDDCHSSSNRSSSPVFRPSLSFDIRQDVDGIDYYIIQIPIQRLGRTHAALASSTIASHDTKRSQYPRHLAHKSKRTKRRTHERFGEEEDALLIHLKEEEHKSWSEIAQHFPKRTKNSLQVHYCTSLRAKK